MKTHIKNKILLSIFTLTFIVGNAQQAQLKKADKKFDNLAYIDAIKVYEEVANKGFEDAYLYKKIADANYFNANYAEAEKWYHKLLSLQPDQKPELYYRYGQSSKSMGNYDNADVYLNFFFKTQNYDYISSKQYLKDINKVSNRFTIDTVTFNTQYSDYPAFYKNDKLYVITAGKSKRRTPWNNEPTSDVFLISNDSLKVLNKDINTKYNEGSLVITKDGNTVYFTRNDYTGKKIGKDSFKTTRLKLYKAIKENGDWTNTEELPFNSSEYSVGHPALSKDDRTLYFVSDKLENSKGGTDIYEVEIFEDGSFGTPFNMAGFNTPGNEMFPFVDNNNVFYFSSNGHPNLGGLDVFMSKANAQGVYSKVYNVGKPINSPYDDFSFMINSTNKGYFASNREGSQSDDVYAFEELTPFKEPCFMLIEGVVKDRKTGDILPNAVVSLLDANNRVVNKMVADYNAKYAFTDIDCDKVKFIRAEKNKYLTKEELIAKTDGRNYSEIFLDRRNISTNIGTNVSVLLNPIYFDLDKSFIRQDARVELEKVIAIMNQYPNIKIDVRSHTDSRATDSYNLSLSERRVQSTINYLVNRGGIAKSRLTGRGYGETELINKCSSGISCTEAEHELNRRSEFIIVK